MTVWTVLKNDGNMWVCFSVVSHRPALPNWQTMRSGLRSLVMSGLTCSWSLKKTHKTSYLFSIVSPLECSCCHLLYFADFIGSKMSRYNHPSVRGHKTCVSFGSRSCTWWAGCVWMCCCHCRPLCRFLTQTGGNVGESHHVTAPPLFYSPSAPGIQLPLSPPSPSIPPCKLPPLPLLPTYSFSKSHRNNGCSFFYALNKSFFWLILLSNYNNILNSH